MGDEIAVGAFPSHGSYDLTVNRQPMTTFWLLLWATALAFGWLLPNHYPPWTTFHMDAWIAAVLSLAAAAVIVRAKGRVEWHGLPTVVAALAVLPVLQFALGQVSFAGTAGLGTAYLLGFVLALLVGAAWESARPGQLIDGLFAAIGLAALVSVGLQLHQWLRLEEFEIWVMPDNYGRPFANFGQPNQLATFHLWGLLALSWLTMRRYIGAPTAIGVAAYLLFGLALTASRASWIGVAIIVLAAWHWRRLLPGMKTPWVVAILAGYFVVCVVSVSALREVLLGGSVADLGELTRATMASENRPAIWAMFLEAAWRKPWWGYGWGQGALAHINVAIDYSPKYVLFSHAHNLLLDLLLWCGIPIGLLLAFFLIRWFWLRFRSIDSGGDAVLFTLLLVTANHAMLELPLHHAYFLLPVGLVAGALHSRLGILPLLTTPRWVLRLLWVGAVGLLSLIVRDYAKVEPEYQQLRFEWAHVRTEPAQPPDVLLLSQFPNFVRVVRLTPETGMPAKDLQRMREITGLFPSPAMFQKLALALALNGQPEEAGVWLRTMCKMVAPAQCAAVTREWVQQARDTAALRMVPWPPK